MLPEDAWAQLWATLQRVLQVRPSSRIPLGPKVLAKKTLAHKGQRSAELGISKPSIWHSFKIAFSGASLERDPVEGKVNCKGSFFHPGKKGEKTSRMPVQPENSWSHQQGRKRPATAASARGKRIRTLLLSPKRPNRIQPSKSSSSFQAPLWGQLKDCLLHSNGK